MLRSLQTLFLIVLILCSIDFFEFQPFQGSIIKYFQFAYLFIAVGTSLAFSLPKREGFVLPVQLISFSIVVSIVISALTWGQNLTDSLAGSILSLIWLVFFYLKHINFPIEKIEKIVVGYGIVYLILYFFQFFNADQGYFINPELIDDSRGVTRIVFPARGVFYLATFIAINKFTTPNQNNRLFWGFLLVMGIVVTIMQVTRQFLSAVAIIYLFHFLKNIAIYKKALVIISFIGLIMYLSRSTNPIVAGLKNSQYQTVEQGSDYIRVKAATFFLTDFSHSTINRVLGNGVPYGKDSSYFRYTSYYTSNYGFWLSDVGLIAVYVMFGVFAVLGYVLIWIKSFVIQLPKEFHYVKYFLWFLLMTGLTSDTVYGSFDLIATVLVIYIYHILFVIEKFKSRLTRI